MTAVLTVAYIVGWLAFFYALIPSIIQGPLGASLYRTCLLHPPSRALGIPFVAAALLITSTWPLALLAWILTGRRPPPLITTAALLDFYSAPDHDHTPVLSRIPRDITKRLAGTPTGLPTDFPSSGDFWVLYLERT